MFRIVKHGVVGGRPTTVAADWFSGVRIDVESGEVAAGNVQPQPVAPGKEIAGRIESDCDLVEFARRQEFLLLGPLAVSQPRDRVTEVQGVSPGVPAAGWVDVNQLLEEKQQRRREKLNR